MAQRALEQRVENLERRVETVEQILPTLATKADLAELEPQRKPTWTSPLRHSRRGPKSRPRENRPADTPTRAEGLRADVRLIAEGLAALPVSTNGKHADIMGVPTQNDTRL